MGWWEREFTRESTFMRGNEFEPAGLGLWPRNPDHTVCTASVTVTSLTLNISNTVTPQGGFPCPVLGCLELLNLPREETAPERGNEPDPLRDPPVPREAWGCGERCPPAGVAEGEWQEQTGRAGRGAAPSCG